MNLEDVNINNSQEQTDDPAKRFLRDFLKIAEGSQEPIPKELTLEEKQNGLKEKLSTRRDQVKTAMLRSNQLTNNQSAPLKEQMFHADFNGSIDERREADRILRQRFEGQGIIEEERGKSEAERQIINSIIDRLNEFVRALGGRPMKLNPENIHILKLTEEDFHEKGGAVGEINADEQNIKIFDYREKIKSNPYIFANILTHELIHAHGYNTVKDVSGSSVTVKRLGIEVFSEKTRQILLSGLNEALTEELTKIFEELYFPEIEILAKEIERRNNLIASKYSMQEWDKILEEKMLLESEGENGEKEVMLIDRSYSRERKELNYIINEIQERFPGKFQSKKDVLLIFGKAMMSGKLKEIAGWLNKAFGKGGFKRVAEGTGSGKL